MWIWAEKDQKGERSAARRPGVETSLSYRGLWIAIEISQAGQSATIAAKREIYPGAIFVNSYSRTQFLLQAKTLSLLGVLHHFNILNFKFNPNLGNILYFDLETLNLS